MKFILLLIALGLGCFIVFGIFMIITAKILLIIGGVISMAGGWAALSMYEHANPQGNLGALAFVGGVLGLWGLIAGLHHWHELLIKQEQQRERKAEAERQANDLAKKRGVELELARLREIELAKATPVMRWFRQNFGW